MELFIIRHAETEDNLLHICQGQLPGRLSAKGVEEASILAHRRLAALSIDRCYCSDLSRAQETLRPFAELCPLTPILYDKRLRERYFGSMQGKPFPSEYSEALLPSEVESIEAMRTRLSALIDEILAQYGSTHQRIMLMSHGFTIRVLCALLQEKPIEEVWHVPEIDNTAVTHFEWKSQGDLFWQLIDFNNTDHLKEGK